MPALLALLLLAYLLGSLSGSLLLGRLRGVDIRQQGSGNAGGTNAFRTQGWRFAIGVLLVDVGKGAAAVWIAWHWPLPVAESALLATQWLALIFAVMGHVWPIFHGFRGGKGVGTLLGGLLLIWPTGVGLFLAVWLTTLVLSGYVGLASVLACWVLPLASVLLASALAQWPGALLSALFISFTHRSNLQRLWNGSEHRFERARFFARRS